MRVDVTRRQYDVVAGQPLVITLQITNTSEVIGGYTVRVLGADPGWVAMEVDQISLFPDEQRVVPIMLTAPQGLPAGARRVAVQVRELTPPHAHHDRRHRPERARAARDAPCAPIRSRSRRASGPRSA